MGNKKYKIRAASGPKEDEEPSIGFFAFGSRSPASKAPRELQAQSFCPFRPDLASFSLANTGAGTGSSWCHLAERCSPACSQERPQHRSNLRTRPRAVPLSFSFLHSHSGRLRSSPPHADNQTHSVGPREPRSRGAEGGTPVVAEPRAPGKVTKPKEESAQLTWLSIIIMPRS